MATTTNYGFTVPTSADLVKNGATAISTLGSNLDTFLFRPFTKNSVLNSDFSVWQRGTSFTSVSNVAYTADRWCVFTGSISGRDVSRQATNDTTNLPFIKYAARVGRASGNTNTTNFFIGQSYESTASTPLAGKTVVISYYARAGANYSSASNVLNVYAGWGTGTDQNIFAGYTGQTSLGVTNATLTTTWQRFTTTGTLGATATEFGLYFGYTPVGTAGANDYFEITGVQVEIGTTATPFTTATGTIQGELAACQRYYYRATSGSSYGYLGALGDADSTTRVQAMLTNPVTMRTNPSAIDYSTVATYDGVAITTVTALTIGFASPTGQNLFATVASGLTQYRNYSLIAQNSTSAYIGLSAEL